MTLASGSAKELVGLSCWRILGAPAHWVILKVVVPDTTTLCTRDRPKRERERLLAEGPMKDRSGPGAGDGYGNGFRGIDSLESLVCYVLHDGTVSSRVVEDVVDLEDTGSRVVLLGEVVEVDLGLGLDENATVLDKISGFRVAL